MPILGKFEREQHEDVFIEAGRTAYRMGITFFGNPYAEKNGQAKTKFAKLWAHGWREECRSTPRVNTNETENRHTSRRIRVETAYNEARACRA